MYLYGDFSKKFGPLLGVLTDKVALGRNRDLNLELAKGMYLGTKATNYTGTPSKPKYIYIYIYFYICIYVYIYILYRYMDP